MHTLPKEYDTLIAVFAPIFSKRVWQQVQVLLSARYWRRASGR